jgi:hypothetical protein
MKGNGGFFFFGRNGGAAFFILIYDLLWSVSTQTQERVDNETGERGSTATEVSKGGEEERLIGSTVLFNARLILCHEAVQINQPNRPHQIPIHYIYVLTPTPASWIRAKRQYTFFPTSTFTRVTVNVNGTITLDEIGN